MAGASVDGSSRCERTAACAIVRLHERQVDVGDRGRLDGTVADVGDDADDFGRVAAAGRALPGPHPLADRILVRPDLPRRRFTDEQHLRLAGAVLIGDVPAAQQPHAERVEQTRRYPVNADGRIAAVAERLLGRREPRDGAVAAARYRGAEAEARRADAGQRADLLEQLRENCCPRSLS